MGQQGIYPKELVFRGQQDSRGHAPLRVYDPVEPVTASPITDQQRREAVRGALMMQRQAQDWETFYREILGVDGLIAKIFPSQAQQRAFEKHLNMLRFSICWHNCVPARKNAWSKARSQPR